MGESIKRLKYDFLKIFREHQAFVVISAVLIILIAVFLRINALSNMPLDQRYLDTESSKIKTVRFNQEAIEQIKELNDSNVTTPKVTLPSNRQNPFNE